MKSDPAPSGGGQSPTNPALSATATTEIPTAIPRHQAERNPTGRRLAILSLTALGVVYGDIGTSPLYSIKEAFKPHYGLEPNVVNVYGVLSLILWSLLLIVTIKYVSFILRADNRGEGGVYALLALVIEKQKKAGIVAPKGVLILLGIFGGAFLYGDGIITPAISVLSAVEGLNVIYPALSEWAMPAAFVIIATLFYFQDHGTARVGGTFGWIMLAWFISIAALGIRGIVLHPEIFFAMNPWYGVEFFLMHPKSAFVVLGAVVLVITGGEALYADMGHFGKKPVRYVWLALVLPSLLLNYFGQGALLLSDPSASRNPFYLLAPSWFGIPLLIIATLAAIVASQALISGAFSLTHQAVQLGYSPRVTIVHTSHTEAGQIYIPEVNALLAAGTLLLVWGFGSADALGAAYGVAVTGTMAITTILFVIVARDRFQWTGFQAWSFLIFFLSIDLAFFASNLLKVPSGGWVPLAAAFSVAIVMMTWKRGRALLHDVLVERSLEVDTLMESLAQGKIVRVPGTAIFMTSEAEKTPVVLLHHLKHNKVLHEQVILLSIISREVPEVPASERLSIDRMPLGFTRVRASYGFMETPNVEEIRHRLVEAGIKTRRMDTTYYLGREQLIAANSKGMQRWRKRLFAVMARNARSATEFFGIPPNRVVELGAQIEF